MNYSTLKSYLLLLFMIICAAVTVRADDVPPPRGTIKGHVITSDNKPASDVTIALQGTKRGTMTNESGYFELTAPAGRYILVASHVGVNSVTVPVEVSSGQTTTLPIITLNSSQTALNEVQISGIKTNRFVVKKSYDVAKMPLSDLENSQSYSSVSKELIQEQAIYSADQAVRNVPGIATLWNATNRAGDGGAYFTLRGFPVQISLWNGVSGAVSNTIDATNLEKLEVIKGPSGTLYGSSLTSFGGLLNRVTKQPYDTLGGTISYSTGSYGFNRASVDLNTPLDSAKKALLRINTSFNSINSFQDAGFDRRFVFAPSFSYKVNDKLSFLFDAEIVHGRGTTPQLMYIDYNIAPSQLGASRADQLNVDYKKSYISNDIVASSDNYNFFGQAEYKFSDQWTSRTTISSTYSTSSGPQTYFYLLAGNASMARMVWDVEGNSSTWNIQQNFNGDFKIGELRNRLLVGIDVLNQRQNISYTGFNSTPTKTANFYSQFFDVVNTVGAVPNYYDFNLANINARYATAGSGAPYLSINNRYTTSAYVSDVLNITDNLLVSAGLRIDHFKNEPVYDPTTNGYNVQGFDQTSLSPKFGVVYQVIKDKVSLFGNYQNGFVNLGTYSAYDANSASGLTNKMAKPEQANQAEGGVKLDVFNGHLSGTISYYDIQVSNLVRSDLTHNNASIQDGTQVSRGFEAEITTNPIEGLNLVAGYAYNHSVITKSTSADQGYRPGTAGSPNLANLWISYRLMTGKAQGLGIGFGGNYASDNKIINGSTGTFTLPAYTVLNSSLFYEQRKFRIALNVNNFTNEKYWVGYSTISPQMLRQYIGSVAYKF